MTSAFDQLPSALRRQGRLARLGPAGVPALLVSPEPRPAAPRQHPPPLVVWIHGRTASKELDPGRYLRLMRSGIAVCALDLPGHGQRADSQLQLPGFVLDVVLQMIDELDACVWEAIDRLQADSNAVGLGGMSAGGMVTLARLCQPHLFRSASVEATTGNWAAQLDQPMFQASQAAAVAQADPLRHLDQWREIPLQVFHSRADTWVPFAGQLAFVEAVRARYQHPDQIELVTFESTGAAHEHAGFGRYAAQVKEQQRAFFQTTLQRTPS